MQEILHAVYLESDLFLWSEGPPGRARARSRRHPFSSVQGLPEGEASEVELELPSTPAGPLPSWSTGEGEASLKSWRIPGVRLGLAEAVACLATCQPEQRPGPGWSFWSAVSRWALELIARERLVPGHQGWKVLLDHPHDAARWQQLARLMPPAATARAGHPARQLADFLQRATSELACHWLQERPVSLSSTRLKRWPETPASWIDQVARGSFETRVSAPERQRLERELSVWTDQLRPQAEWRTSFTLCEPEEGEEDWRVDLALQACHDLSLLVPASRVWKGKAGQAEVLLGDLGRAVRVFPELQRALKLARPHTVELSQAEACRFLESTAWLLEEYGFGVRIPARLSSAGGLTVRARASSSKTSSGASSGQLGLERLVDFQWEVALGDQPLTAAEFRKLARAKQPLARVRGQWVLLNRRQVEQALQLLEQGGQRKLGELLAMASGALPLQIEFERDLAPLAGEARVQELPPPSALRATLRPYQLRGFSWLAYLSERGLGACLADDMGLGKTIQLLSLVLHLRQQRGPAPTLLVCPTSVLGNWQREAQRFAPELSVQIYHGADRKLGEHDLVLTSYSLVARDAEALQALPWRAVVLDEAQSIKNPATRQARAVRSLKAEFRVALTGTPVENRLTELWSIMDFLNPGLLGNLTSFRRDFAVPIERLGSPEQMQQLKQRVQPFLLRRLKSDPLIAPDLPDKQESRTYCPLTREQATLYQAAVDSMMAEVESSEGIERRGLVLSMLLRLKQICNHPALYVGDGSPLSERSGKLSRLEEMLEEVVSEGDAALVFTQFAGFARELTRHLGLRLGCPVLCLHGELSRTERDRLVDSFQAADGPPIMVLSLKAGGVGLNLTRASRVFHYDRWWNPAVESQATDRAYRIGQTRKVQVYKFVCQGTLEESIDRMLEQKESLAREVLSGGEGWLTELDNRHLRELLQLGAEAVRED